MAYVIAEACEGVKDKACVAVCPVDCIHEGTVEVNGRIYDQLFIDPGSCIDCHMCEPECPVGAIYVSNELPKQWRQYIEINEEFFKSGTRTA